MHRVAAYKDDIEVHWDYYNVRERTWERHMDDIHVNIQELLIFRPQDRPDRLCRGIEIAVRTAHRVHAIACPFDEPIPVPRRYREQ